MKNAVSEAIQRLVALVEATPAHFERLSEAEWSSKPELIKWSKKEVLGHLIDSAANNHQRFVRAQQGSPLITPGYSQNFWVESQHYQEVPAQELIVLWVAYNKHLCHILRHISTENLSNTCLISDFPPVDLAFVIEDYVRHLIHHLMQILPSEVVTNG